MESVAVVEEEEVKEHPIYLTFTVQLRKYGIVLIYETGGGGSEQGKCSSNRDCPR